MNFVQTYLAAFLKVPNQCVERQIRDKIYTLTNRHLYYSGQKYTAITIKQKNALFQEEDAGITIYNQSDHPSDDFFDFYSSSNNIGNISYIVEEYSKSKLPVLITGEAGTGKDKILERCAGYLLLQNPLYDRSGLQENGASENGASDAGRQGKEIQPDHTFFYHG